MAAEVNNLTLLDWGQWNQNKHGGGG